MVTSDIDNDVSHEVLGWKIPTWQAFLLHRVLPSCGGLVVYLTMMCFDFTLIYQHYENGDTGVGAFCIILMVVPAVLSLVFTLASPPPGLQTESVAFTVTLQNNDLKWMGMQFVNLIFFPVAAIGRYCHQIFWWVEVTFATYAQDKDRIHQAIEHARAPSPMELYLFLQAFIHCAPHIILNIIDLMGRASTSSFDKFSVQIVSIVASSLRMASTATIYRRFEREKLCGKKYPWSIVHDDAEHDTADDADLINNNDKSEPIYDDVNKDTIESRKPVENGIKYKSDLIDFSPPNSSMPSRYYDDELSDTSSNYLPPLSPSVVSGKHSVFESDDEYVAPISIIRSVAPRRRDTQLTTDSQYTIEKVNITPPPAMEAPRPVSLAVWAEKIMENAESVPLWLSAPYRSKYGVEVIQEEPDIPRRIPRSFVRGLEPQDVSAALVNFLGWHMFFISRLLSIAAFIRFIPFVAIVILFSHYQVMLLFLIVPKASTVKRAFYLFLAFVYVFCLMEFKIRFRHVRVWHVFWFLLCSIETIIFTGVCASLDNVLHDWWKYYVTMVILISMLLSYMCFLVYFAILKPKETIVFINDRINN